MNTPENYKLWQDFLQAWPVERVKTMTLAEYTDLKTDDAFIYWLEFKLKELGSIKGAPAFKFGVFARSGSEKKESKGQYCYDNKYGWLKAFGKTADAAFQNVKTNVLAVIDAVKRGTITEINDIHLSDMFKWKLAFQYQNPEVPILVPIFFTGALCALTQSPTTRPVSEMQQELMAKKPADTDVFDYMRDLWDSFTGMARIWKVSHGQKDFSAEERKECLDQSVIRVHGTTKKGQGKAFAQEAKIGDYFYLCHGNDAGIQLFGRIDSEAEQVTYRGADDWLDRKYHVVAMSTSHEKYTGVSRGWAPSYNSTFKRVPAEELELFDENIAFPFFGKGIDQLISGSPTSSAPPCALNLILYGPPGTGKTWSTVRRAVELCCHCKLAESEYPKDEFNKLAEEGRIQFVTFHQSYDYEQFVEGIAPVMGDAESGEEPEAGGVSYRIERGSFKRVALLAAHAAMPREQVAKREQDFSVLWGRLLGQIENASNAMPVRSKTDRDYLLEVTDRKNVVAKRATREDEELVVDQNGTGLTASAANMELIWGQRDRLPPPENLTTPQIESIIEKGCHSSLIWMLYQKLCELRDEQVSSHGKLSDKERMKIAQQELTDNGSGGFLFEEGVPQYVLIIDEINRGNMSKIFGELITLLEPSKRLGQDDEQIVTLPYSKKPFGVPANLHVIGTMNTADRSIALMDAALRRRFTFEELMPKSEVVKAALEKAKAETDPKKDKLEDDFLIDFVPKLLDAMNKRIEFLYDRDHMLGHSYFMEATGWLKLRDIMLNQVIPLLQEYFYNDWEKICAVLGCPYDAAGKAIRRIPDVYASAMRDDQKHYRYPLIVVKSESEHDVLLCDLEDYDDQCTFDINAAFAEAGDVDELKCFLLPVAGNDYLDKLEPPALPSSPEADQADGSGEAT